MRTEYEKRIAALTAEVAVQREAKDAAIRLWNECGADLQRAEAQAAEYREALNKIFREVTRIVVLSHELDGGQ